MRRYVGLFVILTFVGHAAAKVYHVSHVGSAARVVYHFVK